MKFLSIFVIFFLIAVPDSGAVQQIDRVSKEWSPGGHRQYRSQILIRRTPATVRSAIQERLTRDSTNQDGSVRLEVLKRTNTRLLVRVLGVFEYASAALEYALDLEFENTGKDQWNLRLNGPLCQGSGALKIDVPVSEVEAATEVALNWDVATCSFSPLQQFAIQAHKLSEQEIVAQIVLDLLYYVVQD